MLADPPKLVAALFTPEPTLPLAFADDMLNSVGRFVFDKLRVGGGGGGFIFGGRGGATVGLDIGTLGAVRIAVVLIASCD